MNDENVMYHISCLFSFFIEGLAIMTLWTTKERVCMDMAAPVHHVRSPARLHASPRPVTGDRPSPWAEG
jgi:hypothetical protein